MSARILFLHHTAIIGGAELHLLSLARHFRATSKVILFNDGPFRALLEKAGVNVEVIPSAWAGSGVRGGQPMWSARNLAGIFRLGWHTAQQVREWDLVWANSPRALFVAAIARLVRRRPVIWIVHDLLEEKHFSREGLLLIIRVANRTAARVIADSRAVANAYLTAGGRADRLQIIHCGINASSFPEPTERNGKGAPLFGVFGRITPWKGQEIVLRALAKIPEASAIFVGQEEDHAYAERLRGLTNELHLQERVRFLGFRADAAQLMQKVDCVVHASIDPEPFGLVLVEAMLAERPVVATRAGGALEIIEDGVSGILVAPGDVDELSRALLRIFSNPAEAALLAKNGRTRALTHFSEERMLREIEGEISAVTRRS